MEESTVLSAKGDKPLHNKDVAMLLSDPDRLLTSLPGRLPHCLAVGAPADRRLASLGRLLNGVVEQRNVRLLSEDWQGSYSRLEQPKCHSGCLPDTVAKLFAGVAGWPSLTRILHDEGNRLLLRDGRLGFIRAGGLFRLDGSLTFRGGSTRFLESVHRVLARYPGFIELDESGTEWVVLPQPDESASGSFPAWAVSFPGDLKLLDPTVRRPLCLSGADCIQNRPMDCWPSVVDPVLRNAAAMEQALQMATLLSRYADADLQCILRPDSAAGTSFAGSDLVGLLISPLTTLSRLMILQIDLHPDNDFVALHRSTSAVAAFEVLPDRSVWVQVSEDLAGLLGGLPELLEPH